MGTLLLFAEAAWGQGYLRREGQCSLRGANILSSSILEPNLGEETMRTRTWSQAPREPRRPQPDLRPVQTQTSRRIPPASADTRQCGQSGEDALGPFPTRQGGRSPVFPAFLLHTAHLLHITSDLKPSSIFQGWGGVVHWAFLTLDGPLLR